MSDEDHLLDVLEYYSYNNTSDILLNIMIWLFITLVMRFWMDHADPPQALVVGLEEYPERVVWKLLRECIKLAYRVEMDILDMDQVFADDPDWFGAEMMSAQCSLGHTGSG